MLNRNSSFLFLLLHSVSRHRAHGSEGRAAIAAVAAGCAKRGRHAGGRGVSEAKRIGATTFLRS